MAESSNFFTFFSFRNGCKQDYGFNWPVAQKCAYSINLLRSWPWCRWSRSKWIGHAEKKLLAWVKSVCWLCLRRWSSGEDKSSAAAGRGPLHEIYIRGARGAAAFLSRRRRAGCDRRIITLMGRHLLRRAINNASRRRRLAGASLVTGRAAKRHLVPGDCGWVWKQKSMGRERTLCISR